MKGATLNKPTETRPTRLPASRRTRAAAATSPAVFFGADSERSFALDSRDAVARRESVGRFCLDRFGQGRPIVFLHGLGSEMADLRAIADLSGGHRVQSGRASTSW